MTFHDHRPTGLPLPATDAAPPTQASSTVASDNPPLHADYNLHPLLVRSLDHYVEPAHGNERFQIR